MGYFCSIFKHLKVSTFNNFIRIFKNFIFSDFRLDYLLSKIIFQKLFKKNIFQKLFFKNYFFKDYFSKIIFSKIIFSKITFSRITFLKNSLHNFLVQKRVVFFSSCSVLYSF